MISIEVIREFLDEKALVIDGLDEAVVGYSDGGLLVYDHGKTVNHFVQDGMTRDEAVGWVDFNVLGLQGNGAGFVMLYRPDDE